MCMANACAREARYDLDTWPLCRHCWLVKQDIARRWGPREEPPGSHARKEVLGGPTS
jgi:hypothetical protein